MSAGLTVIGLAGDWCSFSTCIVLVEMLFYCFPVQLG